MHKLCVIKVIIITVSVIYFQNFKYVQLSYTNEDRNVNIS